MTQANISAMGQIEIRSGLAAQNEKTQSLFCDIPAKDSQPAFNYEETSNKPQLRTFYKVTGMQSTEVSRAPLGQTEGDTRTRSNVGSWIGSNAENNIIGMNDDCQA